MPVEVITTIAGLRARLAQRRGRGVVGFVPTMGALHEGHASLLRAARAECATVVASIFVNPTQFDRPEDLEKYPRTLDADLRVCDAAGVDVVFAPAVEEMYPRPLACAVEVGRLADHLCGRFRPGHFRGMATVVMKLLQIVQADRAYFGEKDAQQLAIIRRLVADFDVPTTIVGVPTVREPDGLALSSRNVHLTASERQQAPALYRALCEAARQIQSGVTDPAAIVKQSTKEIPQDDGVRLEYLEVVDPEELQPVVRVSGPALVAGALWVGKTRLIDNVTAEERRTGVPATQSHL
jgi:pantoate--beta-alanine ligase